MLSFLKLPDRQPPRIHPLLNNVKRTFTANHTTFVKYWRNMNWVVKSDHILVGLIVQLSTNAFTPIDIYNSIRRNLDGVTMNRGIGSSVGYAKVQPKSHFYGHECKEILIEQPFDDSIQQLFSTHYTEWETIRAVQHPFTSFDYQLANGKLRHSGEYGICVLKMDLALLYTQYVLWRRDTFRSKYEDGTSKSIMNFVHSYPIVNLVKSHNERVWYNRLFNKVKSETVSNYKPDNRPVLLDPYLYLDQIQDKLIDDMEKSRANFHEWCCWIPGITTKNLKEHLKQDNTLSTQQNRLPWLLGELSTIEMLVRLELITNTNASTGYCSEIVRLNKNYLNSRLYGTIKGLPFEEINHYMITNIINPISLLL